MQLYPLIDPYALRIDGTNSPTAAIDWGNQNLTNINALQCNGQLTVGNNGATEILNFNVATSDVTFTVTPATLSINSGQYYFGDSGSASAFLEFVNSGTNVRQTCTSAAMSIGAASFTTTGLGTFGNLDVDTLNLNGNAITDSTGTISFDNENLTTSGLGTFGTGLFNGEVDILVNAAEFTGEFGGSALRVNDEAQTDTTRNAFEAWSWPKVGTDITGGNWLAGFFGGVRDAGAGTDDISTAYGASGNNYFAGTGVRTHGDDGIGGGGVYAGYFVTDVTGSNLTITNNYGLYVNPVISGSPVVTNQWGIRLPIPNAVGSTINWSILSENTADSAFAGALSVGKITSPTVTLDVLGETLLTGAVIGTDVFVVVGKSGLKSANPGQGASFTTGNGGTIGDQQGGDFAVTTGNGANNGDGGDFEVALGSGAGTGTNGEAKIGDGTNQTVIEQDGTIRFDGNATAFEDLQVSISNIRVPTSNAPTERLYNHGIGGGVTFPSLGFALNEYIYFDVQTHHAMKLNTILDNHIHFMTPTDGSGTPDRFKFQFDVIAAAIDGSWAAPAGTPFTSEHIIAADYSNAHKLLEIADIPSSNSTVSTIYKCKLTRIAATQDEYAGEVYLEFTDCHYEKDTVGSRTEGVK